MDKSFWNTSPEIKDVISDTPTDKKRAVEEWVSTLGKNKPKKGELSLEGEMTSEELQLLARKYIAKEKLRRIRIEELRKATESINAGTNTLPISSIEKIRQEVDALRTEVRNLEEQLRKEGVNVTEVEII